MSAIQSVFRSRFGCHPCDYATYRKLKILNGVYERAIRLAHAWKRWKRKDPHNRVIRRRIRNEQGQTIGYADPVPLPEPAICPVFSRKVQEKRFVDKKGNHLQEGFLDEKVVTDDPRIATDYSTARRPQADPSAVRPLGCTLAEIDELLEKARAWLEEQDVKGR
jgi:hypothetical protein